MLEIILKDPLPDLWMLQWWEYVKPISLDRCPPDPTAVEPFNYFRFPHFAWPWYGTPNGWDAQLSVTFSGITPCPCDGGRLQRLANDPNGTYILTYNHAMPGWLATGVVLNVGPCDDYNTQYPSNFTLRVRLTGSNDVIVEFFNGDWYTGYRYIFYSAASTRTQDGRINIRDFPNELQQAECSNHIYRWAYGGQATLARTTAPILRGNCLPNADGYYEDGSQWQP